MTAESATSRRSYPGRGRLQQVLGYFYENQNKDITIQMLEKHFKGQHTHHQLMASMAHLINVDMQKKYKFPIDKVTTGVWRFRSTLPRDVQDTQTPSPNGYRPTQLTNTYIQPRTYEKITVTVIKETDDGSEMVVVDDNTNIYRMVKVG